MVDKQKNKSPEAGDESKSEDDSKGKVLSLIESKPSRRKRRAKEPEASVEPPVDDSSSVENQKKNALDLFEEKPKKKKSATKAKERPMGSKLAPLKRGIASDPIAAALLKGQSAPGVGEQESESAKSGNQVSDAVVEEAQAVRDGRLISIKPPIIIKELADLMNVKSFQIIKDLMELDVFANPSQAIEADIAVRICEKHGFIFEREKREKGAGVHKPEDVVEEPSIPEEEPEDEMKVRAPIITVMGHVDHGKTSLIDRIRKSQITEGEAGGITQHIAAYRVTHNGQPITFLDTPGHAVFTEMRSRGAQVTDVVVLVVAADDGFMPQTDEALNHAKAAGVQILVAINKCDLPSANIDRVKSQMQERELMPEDWGGDVITVPVSAITGEGIDDLLEMIALQSEVLELKANPRGTARAAVIEARVQQGQGSTATVIVQSGTLKLGMPFICGGVYGKVKSLVNDHGERIQEAGPSTPVEVIGFSTIPNVGDEVVEMKSERDAKKLSDERLEDERQEKLQAPQRARLENLFASMDESKKKALKLVVKGDVQGTVQAICSALRDIESDKVNLDIIHAAAGPISENDVLLCSASDAVVIGFNVKLESTALKTAKREGVQVKLFSIIYELIDQVKEAMLGLLEMETREKVLGRAEVMQVFKIKKGRAAGCMVRDGKILRSGRGRVLRQDQAVYDGPIGTLRRYQDDVDEIKIGVECGIRLGEYNEYEVGDIIECYQLEKFAQTL